LPEALDTATALPPVTLLTCDRVDDEVITQALLIAGDSAAPVVVVCDHVDDTRLRALLAAGVNGIVCRDELAATLIPTIEAVRAGQVCLPAANARALKRPVLSIREKQVVGLVALGLTNAEIAGRLFIAECTVKSHLSSAFGKLGVHSRHEAIDLIVDPASGFGIGILSLEAEPVAAGRELE
jgi:DNA-binding NarL/FixJ family response regulator